MEQKELSMKIDMDWMYMCNYAFTTNVACIQHSKLVVLGEPFKGEQLTLIYTQLLMNYHSRPYD